MRPPPINLCDAHRIECPNPLCQRQVGSRHVFKGFMIDKCPHCGVDYIAWATLGVGHTIGLTPEQAASIDPEEDRLTVVLRQLGRMQRAS